MKVAVIAFGTRGDVQPLVILAAGLASSSAWCSKVVVVTHEQHAHFVESLLTNGRDSERLTEIATVDSPPVLWKGTPELDAAEARANLAQQHGCMEACRGAGLVIFNMFALEGFHISEAYSIPCVVCHPYLTATTMPSSFPARMRRVHPHLFRRLTRLSDKPGELSKVGRDRLASSSEDSSEGHAATRGGCLETAWAHLEHWMWPLFTDKWGPFREQLGLDPCPFQEDGAMEPSEVDQHGLLTAGNGAIDALRTVDPRQLPLVLYLFSPLVVDLSPFWPQCVRICGYLFPSPATTKQRKGGQKTSCSLDGRQILAPQLAEQPSQLSPEPTRASDKPASDIVIQAGHDCPAPGKRCLLPPDVEGFLSARDDRPIYIGFGSMWGMCSPGYRLSFALGVLLLGARQAGFRCVVSLPTREPAGVRKDNVEGAERLRELDSAMEWVLGESAASESQGDLLVHQGPLVHGLLLPRCSAAIHHGGSGTTAAVFRAGIPHVVCPQQLDQFFWAERVRYLAVGAVLERSLFVERDPSPTKLPDSLVCQAAAAISSVLTPQAKLRAACLGVKIRAENGLENALNSLSLFLSERTPTAAMPPHQPNTTGSRPFTTLPCTDTPMSALEHACAEEAGGNEVLVDGVSNQSSRGCGEGCGVRVGKDLGEEELVLREMPNGLKVWGGTNAEEETFYIYGEVFEDRTYARMGIRVQDGDTVWDVGANVGLATMFFELETDTPDSLNVYAFEPVPSNSTALRRNLSSHCPTALVLPYALGAKHEDRVPATFYPRMPGNSTLRPLEKERLQGRMGCTAGEPSPPEGKVPVSGLNGKFFHDAQQVACSVRTVSWAMANLSVDKIDLLKIDVEGVELDVLQGVGERDWPKIRQVVVEVHPVGDRVTRVCNLLRDHGFDVSAQALGLDGTPLSPSRVVSTAVDAVNKEGTDTKSLHAAGNTFPRKEQSKSRQGQCKDAAEGTNNDPEHPATDGNNEAWLLTSTSDDDRGEGDGPSDWRDDVAQDGLVFMVYAKRS